jgi:hypothetical protein
MKAVKVLNLSGNRYVLPDGMATKDIQSLVGFLAVLQAVGSEYDYGISEYLSYPMGGTTVQLEDMQLGERSATLAHCKQSYVDYKAKKAKAEAEA